MSKRSELKAIGNEKQRFLNLFRLPAFGFDNPVSIDHQYD